MFHTMLNIFFTKLVIIEIEGSWYQLTALFKIKPASFERQTKKILDSVSRWVYKFYVDDEECDSDVKNILKVLYVFKCLLKPDMQQM